MPGPRNTKKSLKTKTTITMTTIPELNTLPMLPVLYFRSFLEIADYKSIGQFCTFASSTSNGTNPRLLWKCTMDEGEKWGIKKGKKLGMKEGLEEGINLGHEEEMNLGYEEGYLMAKGEFNRIIQGVKDKGTLKNTTTHKTVTQTDNDNPQWQSTATQTTPTSTANAVMKMVPNKLLHLLNNVGMSTEPLSKKPAYRPTRPPPACQHHQHVPCHH